LLLAYSALKMGAACTPKKFGTFAPDYKGPHARILAIFRFTITRIPNYTWLS